MFVFSSLILLDNIGFSPNGSTLSCTDTVGVASAAAMPACPVNPHAKTPALTQNFSNGSEVVPIPLNKQTSRPEDNYD